MGVGVMRIRFSSLGALALLAFGLVSCGGNATPVGVTVSPTGTTQSPVPVIANGTQAFGAAVSGTSVGGVTWQVCLPGATTLTLPTMCSPAGPNQTALTGFGTIISTGTATALYTAPPKPPVPNNFVVVATSVANTSVFSSSNVSIVSGVSVIVNPTTPVSMGTQETFQFTDNVTGTSNQAVTWSVASGNSGDIPGGNAQIGTITTTGLFTAPRAAESATIKATSAADPSVFGSQTVDVVSLTSSAPTVTSIDPTTAAAGSVQQDVYITGTNFLTTTVASVATAVLADGTLVNQTAVPSTLISSTLMRATIPGTLMQGAGGAVPTNLFIQVASQNNLDISVSEPLSLLSVRPAIVASTPASVGQAANNTTTVGVNVIGGFFTPQVKAFFGGLGFPAGITPTDSRQMSVTVPGAGAIAGADLTTPGLYPIVLQNANIVPPAAGMSAVNLAVQPSSSSIPTGAPPGIAVGNGPSAIAIDAAAGEAVVVNTTDNSVSVVDLASDAVTTIPNVGKSGNQPTGVAVDDLLPHHLALVVNNTDNTLAVIDLTAGPAIIGTVSLNGFTPQGSSPFAIGINPLTHRALVANTVTNLGTVIDLVNANPIANPPSNTAPCPIATVGNGNLTNNYATGPKPAVAVDERLNFAIATPGGLGNINFVDLGRPPSPGDGGRPPAAFGAFSLSGTVQGVGVNSETHQLLLADPTGPTPLPGNPVEPGLSTFSFLDNSVGGIPLETTQVGFVAAAVNSLTNVGIAVNANGNFATVVDLSGGQVLQTINLAAGSSPQAVAVDQVTGQAVVANAGNGTISVLNIGAPRGLEIVETSPAIVFAPTPDAVTLQIVGIGFSANSQVLLDNIQLAGANVNVVSAREIVATVPANMLTTARRFIVSVQDSVSGLLSNVTDLTVIQQVLVGSTPFGVAVDTDRDLAVVTNSGEGTVSIVDLTGATTGTPGTLTGANVPVGTTPEGVAVIPRLGLAIVANNGSNNITAVDVTRMTPQVTADACPSGSCTGPIGVAVDSDNPRALVTNNNASFNPPQGNVELFTITGPNTTVVPNTPTVIAGPTITETNQDPLAVAVDPTLDVAAAATEIVQTATSQTSGSLDVFVPGELTLLGSIQGLEVPTAVLFDSLNQVFVVGNSLENDLLFVAPTMNAGTPINTSVGVAMNPTSLDYNFQTSTLVTVNSASNTISILDYLCPPAPIGPITCPAPQARSILGLITSQNRSTLVQFTVAIDPKLNLAVLVDQANSRVLLFPLPN